MREFSQKITVPKEKTASVAIWIEGVGYQGELYLEGPYLRDQEFDLLPDFSLSVPDKDYYHWSGQYLSKKEWPAFQVSLNGKTVYEGEIFERSHVKSEWELDLPFADLQEQNTLTYTLISDYHDPLPYAIHEIGLIEQEGGEVALIHATEFTKVGQKAFLLLRTEKPDTAVSLSADLDSFSFEKEHFFQEAGLHAIPLLCKRAGKDLPFTLTFDGGKAEGKIGGIFQGDADRLKVGSGDMIYIKQDLKEMEEYLSWYFSSGMGNFITIRPAYRWSGTEVIDPEVWRLFTRLMEETDTAYALMLDGREAQGLACSPDEGQMAGPCYLGAQGHETDGALAYWGSGRMDNRLAALQMHNLWMRIADEDPTHVFGRWTSKNLLISDKDQLFRHRNPNLPRDMKEGAAHMVERLRGIRYRERRHTGPSALFKYFIQAGYSWVGAETMYTSMEPILSFLRGTKTAYHLPAVGVHHALQWCYNIHNIPSRYRRYRLALYTSYLLGADEINTEEGLWRIEHYYAHFHRFSDCLKSYLKEHQDFYRYLSSHTRKGTFHTPLAFLHGRYDGFLQSGNAGAWGWRAANGMPSGAFPEAENGWNLFSLFYPLALPRGGLKREAPEGKPIGCYSGTPLGQVDTVPVEEALSSRYRTAAFIGYNCAEEEDFARLADFVQNGGRLLLTRAHLSHTTDLAALRKGALEFKKMPLSFTEGDPVWEETTYQGVPMTLCKNIQKEGLLSCIPADNGTPLLCRYSLGKGQVYLFNTPSYPADPSIFSLYEQTLRECAEEEIAKEPLWARVGEDVEFSVYQAEDGSRSLYLLAVDWYRDPAALRRATLLAEGFEYPISLPFGVMLKAVLQEGTLLYPHSEEAEVLSIGKETALLQGVGRCEFTICKEGKQKTVSVDFCEPVLEISL